MEQQPHASGERGLGPDPATVTNVVVVRPGGLGDVVKAVPALRHLRRSYAGARLSVAADGPAIELLDACPYVDRTIDLALPSELLLERFDVAVSLKRPGTVLVPGARLGTINARLRVAYRAEGDEPRFEVNPSWPRRQTEAASMLRLVWLLGGAEPDPSLALWPTLADRNGAARLLGAQGDQPLALVHAGARSAARRWRAEGWGRVCDTLAALGFHVVLVGGASDAAVADEVAAASGTLLHDLTGATGVGVLAGLIERAALFVGTDSGPAVLAGALGTQSLVVGPASSIEQVGVADVVTYVAAGPCAECGEVACNDPAPPASDVPLEPVLAQLLVSAERAARSWRGQRLA